MSPVAVATTLTYAMISIALAMRLWCKDVFFAAFFSALVLYSLVSQLGYLVFPELSEIAIRMYFGEEILPYASVFSLLSLLALYVGHSAIYQPIVRRVRIRTVRRRQSTLLYASLCFVQVLVLAACYLYYADQLSYANASDEDFLTAMGVLYKLFWALYKFTTFTLIVHYAVARQRLAGSSRFSGLLWTLFTLESVIFVCVSMDTGNRTDPLATVIGLLAFEYFERSRTAGSERTTAVTISQQRRQRRKLLLTSAVVLGLTVVLLTQLESSRGGGVETNLDSGLLVQALFLKDYYTPFHVLIGAMANNYIAPGTAMVSNTANALMFLNIDYLQYFVVETWNPGSVTRSASPAMFAFTEGYVVAGWAGWVYNGVIWSFGFALWRCLARTDREAFNVVASAIVMCLVMVTARSQSSYFIKTLYLSIAPALLLYCLASGVRWRLLPRRVLRTLPDLNTIAARHR